ncbi:MAG: hypothetical protein FJZ89_03230 [Chloroflexi bacterium]|nr:hypothetical protein [Chloroflexota bacterium]
MSDYVLWASEIGEYEYCARAWWLGWVRGEERADQARLAAGVQRHAQHGQQVIVADWARRLAIALLALAGLLVLAWLFKIPEVQVVTLLALAVLAASVWILIRLARKR